MDGIDDLQRLINDYLGELVGVIYTCGGDIQKFAGDAIICTFSDHSQHYQTLATVHEDREYLTDAVHAESMKSVCTRAVECALLLRDIYTEELTVHVALSIGEICFGILGGYHDKFECLISGACLTEISSCLDDAKSRQIVVTAALWSIINNPSHHVYAGVKLDSGNYRIDEQLESEYSNTDEATAAANSMVANYLDPGMILGGDAINESRLESFIPTTVISDMSVGMQHFAELREVVTMFVKWETYDYHTHRDLITLQDAFHTAQRIIYEYGGFIRQFLVDDKGCVLIALWGVPSASFVDNAYRALNSAIQLQHNLSHKHDMLTSIGITTGTVFCGTVGSYLRKEYAAIGASVNMAARFMSKASFDIYLDHATVAKLPRMSMEYLHSLGKMAFKGKAEPMEVFKYHAGARDGQPNSSSSSLPEKGGATNGQNNGSTSLQSRIREKLRECVIQCLDVIARDDLHDENVSNKHTSSSLFKKSTLERVQHTFRHISLISMLNMSDKSSCASSDHGGSERSNHSDNKTQDSPTQLLLIKESTGHINPTVKHWLRDECDRRGLTFFHLVLLESDYKVGGYITWKKLLKCILGVDRFDDEKQLLEYLVSLLLDSTNGDYDAIELVLLPAIRLAFGISHGGDNSNNTAVNDNNDHVIVAARKIPPRLMHETVERVIAYALQRGGYFLLIERAHFMSEDSLKVMFLLRRSLSSSMLMLCAGSHDATSSSASNNGSIYNSTKINMRINKIVSKENVSVSQDKEKALLIPRSIGSSAHLNESDITERDIPAWALRRLVQSSNCFIISLADYNNQEILDALKQSSSSSVVVQQQYSFESLKKLADLIYQVSAGNPFWVEEILDFIYSAGIGSFMHMLLNGNNSGTTATQREDSGSGTIGPGGLASTIRSTSNNVVSNISPALHLVRRSSSVHRTNTDAKITEDEAAMQAIDTATAQQQQFDMSKLETFIICRFEQLTSDDQKVARIASVVGHTFDQFLLYAILPRRLKAVMYRSLRILTESKWISSLTNDDAEYAFNHPFIASTLAKLNPGKEKRYIHRCCAQFLEEGDNNNNEQLTLEIIRHYGECDEGRAFDHCFSLLERRFLQFNVPSLQVNFNPQLDEIIWRVFFLGAAYASSLLHIGALRKLAQRYEIEVEHRSQQQLLAQIHNERQSELLSQVQNINHSSLIPNQSIYSSPAKQAMTLSPSKVVPITEEEGNQSTVASDKALPWWSLFICYSNNTATSTKVAPFNRDDAQTEAQEQQDREHASSHTAARWHQQKHEDLFSEQTRLFAELFQELDERSQELNARPGVGEGSDDSSVYGSAAPSPYPQQAKGSHYFGSETSVDVTMRTQIPFR